jgi:Fe-Mn family superoxide dismutase
MKTNGGGTPGGKLADQITKDFGGFDSFKAHMGGAAKVVEGSGWGLLVYDTELNKLLVLQVQNHQNLAVHGAVPLLTVDVWEHAYYLDYKNLRGDYVDKWWNVVNWEDVQMRFEKAKL